MSQSALPRRNTAFSNNYSDVSYPKSREKKPQPVHNSEWLKENRMGPAWQQADERVHDLKHFESASQVQQAREADLEAKRQQRARPVYNDPRQQRAQPVGNDVWMKQNKHTPAWQHANQRVRNLDHFERDTRVQQAREADLEARRHQNGTRARQGLTERHVSNLVEQNARPGLSSDVPTGSKPLNTPRISHGKAKWWEDVCSSEGQNAAAGSPSEVQGGSSAYATTPSFVPKFSRAAWAVPSEAQNGSRPNAMAPPFVPKTSRIAPAPNFQCLQQSATAASPPDVQTSSKTNTVAPAPISKAIQAAPAPNSRCQRQNATTASPAHAQSSSQTKTVAPALIPKASRKTPVLNSQCQQENATAASPPDEQTSSQTNTVAPAPVPKAVQAAPAPAPPLRYSAHVLEPDIRRLLGLPISPLYPYDLYDDLEPMPNAVAPPLFPQPDRKASAPAPTPETPAHVSDPGEPQILGLPLSSWTDLLLEMQSDFPGVIKSRLFA